MYFKEIFDCGWSYPNYRYDDFINLLGKYKPNNDELKDNHICKIQITFNNKGYEPIFANTFDLYFSSTKPFIFISQHMYCIEIHFYYKDTEEIMKAIYEIIQQIDLV